MEFCVVFPLCGVPPHVLVVSLDAQSTQWVCDDAASVGRSTGLWWFQWVPVCAVCCGASGVLT